MTSAFIINEFRGVRAWRLFCCRSAFPPFIANQFCRTGTIERWRRCVLNTIDWCTENGVHISGKPNSSKQKCRLTDKGRKVLKSGNNRNEDVDGHR